jgi:hypothetical protein
MCHDGSTIAIIFADVFGALTPKRQNAKTSKRRAVERRGLPVGANPTRQLSLQPVAIGAVVEVTKRLKPSV